MGFFSDDTSKADITQKSAKKPGLHNQGFFARIVHMILGTFLEILASFFNWLFRKGDSVLVGNIKGGMITALVLLVLYGLFQIPYLRGNMFVANTRTVNIHNGSTRISFPDNSSFAPDPNERKFSLPDVKNVTYVSYTGYSSTNPTFTKSNTCYMVSRGEKLLLDSKIEPKQAEGFEDEVKYRVKYLVPELVGLRYFFVRLFNPKLYTVGERELNEFVHRYSKKDTWYRLEKEWGHVLTGSYKVFEVKARSNEHAVICF
jgi:hypothetical protein